MKTSFSIFTYYLLLFFIKKVFIYKIINLHFLIIFLTMKKNEHNLNLFYFNNHMGIKIYLINFKLQIRNFLTSNSKGIINIKMVLGCFPILFGVSKTLYSKHQDHIFSNLLKDSLPGICSLSIKLSWPTLEQIFLDQLQFDSTQFLTPNINKSYIKRIDFYTDSMLIRTNLNWYTKQKQIYIGAFNGSEQAQIQTKKQIGNNWYTVFSRCWIKTSFLSTTQFKNKKNYSFVAHQPLIAGNQKADQNKKNKNWNLYPAYDTENNFALQFNCKSNTIVSKNNYTFNLDELPAKLNCGSIFKPLVFNDILENVVPTINVKFKQKKKRIHFKNVHKNNLPSKLPFSANTFLVLPTTIISGNKIATKKTLFFSQKIFNSKLTNSLENGAQKPNLYPDFMVLKGTQNRIFQNEIHLNNANSDFENFLDRPTFESNLHFPEIRLNKKKNLENKLKENFYNKNLLPFSNLNYLHFPTNVLKQKNFQVEINLLVESVYSKAWVLSSTELLSLIQLIEELALFHENCIIAPTAMSGYMVPDTSNEQNLSLVVKFLYKSRNHLLHTFFLNSFKELWNSIFQITIPKNFAYSLNLVNPNLNSQILKFYPQSQHAYYFLPYTHEKNIYQGPSVGQNTVTNELNIINPTELKKWIKEFLNADTISSDRRETFFGKNAYAGQKNKFQLSNLHYSSNAQSKLNKIKHIQTGLLKKGRSIPLFEMPLKSISSGARQKNANGEVRLSYKEILEPRSIILCDEYSYIVYLDQKEWKIFSEKLSEEKNELIPIANVKFPRREKNWDIWSLNQSNSENRNNLIFSRLGKKTTKNTAPTTLFATPSSIANGSTKFNHKQCKNKYNQIKRENYISSFLKNPNFNFSDIPISYHYFPYSPTLLKEILPRKYFFGKTYKKNFSMYTNQNLHKNKANKLNALFYDSVEPISNDSWLFFAQFSVGLFLLHILQNIFQKYGKEMKYGISSLVEGKTESSNLIDSTLNGNDDNFRLIKNIEKNFYNIAGIDILLPELSEIVWFLRNSGRSFKIGNTIPRRILLTGPPGTGKTLLVQAIAGEAEVPVLIESGSSLNQPGSSENGSERLQNIFRKAREIAPCIIFIDEIDSFGKARNQMVENPIVKNEIFDSISLNDPKLIENTFQIENFSFLPQSKFSSINRTIESVEQSDLQNDSFIDSSNEVFNEVNKNVNQKNFNRYTDTQQKANILMQFLIELDGIATEKKILVFGATNRPQILDAALTRPGRFNKVFNLNLPNKQKRIEILKLYSKNLGIDTHIAWNYLASLTSGLSAADLASVMNQSSLKAIQNETIHTVQTIEYGIASITGYNTQKNQLKSFTRFQKNESEMVSKSIFINRLAYYQAGKAVVHSLLQNHPRVVSIYLWPEIKNTRYHLINGIIEKEFSQIRTRIELESRIIGFYSGKAAELLALFHTLSMESNDETLSSNYSTSLNRNSMNYLFLTSLNLENFKSHKKYSGLKKTNKMTFLYSWQSDLGVQDMSFAGWLAQLMVNKWYLYSKEISITKLHQFQNNSNIENISDYEMLDVLKEFSYEIENEKNRDTISVSENSQNWITKPWLQKQIIKKLEFSYSNNTNWYKIYEGDHEENENTRCVPSDEYYHNNTYLKNLLNQKSKPMQTVFSTSVAKQYMKQNTEKTFFKSSLTWLDIAASNRDCFYHSLILACFNKSIAILDKNREILDFFASYLIQKEIIREHEVNTIITNFKKNGINTTNSQEISSEFSLIDLDATQINNKANTKKTVFSKKKYENIETSGKKTTKKIVQKNWSKWLGKRYFRFIDFENL